MEITVTSVATLGNDLELFDFYLPSRSRCSRQLSRQVLHHALPLLQLEQRVQLCFEERLQLLAKFGHASARYDDAHHGNQHQELRVPVLGL